MALAGLVAAGIVGVLLIALAGGDLGTVPEWAAAIGTVGAFGVSIYLLSQSMEDRHRAQAERVHAWVEDIEAIGGRPVRHRIWAELANTSESPVYGVRLIVATAHPHGPGVGFPGCPRSLSPGQSLTLDVETTLEYPAQADPMGRGGATLRLRFRDAAGRGWERLYPEGRLSRFTVE